MMHWLPENIASYGQGIDDVIRLIYYITGAWFLLAEAVLIYFVVRYRRNKRASYQPATTWKALAWVLVPAVLVLGFDLGIDAVQGPVWDEIKIHLPAHPDQTVRIQGKQFVWEFSHPGPDNRLGTPDDIETLNQLTVPLDATIRFDLTAADVLHSFWVPNLRLKQDAVPGRTISGWFRAIREGTYPIACAELCGSGHGMMRGQLHVLNKADYQKWLDENSPETQQGVAHVGQ